MSQPPPEGRAPDRSRPTALLPSGFSDLLGLNQHGACLWLHSFVSLPIHVKGGYLMKAATVRIEDDVLGSVDDLAKELNRSRNWIINQALTRFIEYDDWFVREVRNGLKEVERGEIATDAEVKERFRLWGVDARFF